MARLRLAPRLATFGVCVVAGAMLASSALAARGLDLRPDRNADLVTLVHNARGRHDELTARAAALQAEIDELAGQQRPDVVGPSAELRSAVGTTPVVGPAVLVTLTDAPVTVKPAGVDEDLLVVHQQDIQAVLNALFSAGAEAATVQGQRVGPRTGIKCVGNTVILDGVPYAPPYVVAAIGDQAALEKALSDSAYLKAYRRVADQYGLGWQQGRAELTMPAWSAPATLEWARPR